MKVILLKDLGDGTLDAIILSHETTAVEIQEIVNGVREDTDVEYQFEEILKRLPKDCEVHENWNNLLPVVAW